MVEPKFELKPESVWDYPRPPVVLHVPQVIRVELGGVVIAESKRAKRVLETSHPPVYYIPPQDILADAVKLTVGSSWCEWKGQAAYYDVEAGGLSVFRGAWAYPNPVPVYAEIEGYLAFYPDKMSACYVGDEKVQPQEGGFYGGWITSNLKGPFKGAPGTMGW